MRLNLTIYRTSVVTDASANRRLLGMRTLTFFLSILMVVAELSANDAAELLPSAHAHNDYKHAAPLSDALSHGFQSVEADIFLVEGQLLVAHDLVDVKPERTLQSLYLDPLKERVTRNNGRVYAKGDKPFFLLIDFKSEGEKTYQALHETLVNYRDMLTEFTEDSTQQRAVTIIISGNRPRALMASLKPRLAGYDGRLTDLETADPHFTPWISDNWTRHFQWRGKGKVPQADRDKLKALVDKAHAKQLQLRLWAIPDQRTAWKLMHDNGVDFINTDDLAGLSAFLNPPSSH